MNAANSNPFEVDVAFHLVKVLRPGRSGDFFRGGARPPTAASCIPRD